MAEFLLYWLPVWADRGVAGRWRLTNLGSYHFRRLEPGDGVWLCTARRGRLALVGRTEAAECLAPGARARRVPEEDRWPGAFQAIAARGRSQVMREVALPF